jgi:hypothetical protein
MFWVRLADHTLRWNGLREQRARKVEHREQLVVPLLPVDVKGHRRDAFETSVT